MKNTWGAAFLLTLLSLLLSTSCTKESIKSQYLKQETNIESFIQNQLSSNASYRVVDNAGSQRLVVVEGEGDELSKDGTISFYYAGYVLTGSSVSSSSLFATNSRDIATQASWELSDEDAFLIKTINLGETDLVEGLRNGLVGVKGGEECYILFSGKYGFGKRKLGTIPANSALVYHIWVESINNE